MPTWILWLSPVIVAPLLAVLWISWSARPKGPEEAREGVQQYDRFRAALSEHPGGEHAGEAAASAEASEDGRGRGSHHRLGRRAS